MIQLIVVGAQTQVAALPNGGKQLTVIDPQSGIAVHIPFDPEPAPQIGQQLASSLEVAAQMPNGHGSG